MTYIPPADVYERLHPVWVAQVPLKRHRISDPLTYGPTFQEVKDYLRSEFTIEDPLISALITASYMQVCNECNRDFAPTSYSFDVFSSSYVYITTQDVNYASTGALYNRADGAYLQFDQVWSGPVTYSVGMPVELYPANVKVAQYMLIAHWYENRHIYGFGPGAPVKLDFTTDALLSPWRLTKP